MNWYEIALGVVLIAVSFLPLHRSRRARACLPPSWVITPLWLPAVSVASMQSWLS